LALAFGSVCLVLVIAQVAGLLQWLQVRNNIDRLADHALTSIRIVQRMGLDIERERILVDRHILAHEPAQMVKLERQIDRVARDFNASANAYSPLVTFPGLAAAWEQLTFDTDALEPRIEAALELSRHNADAEAELALSEADPIYDGVEHDVRALVAINQATADRTQTTIEQLQTNALELQAALAIVALVLIVLLAIRVIRAISRREALIAANALALENRNRELDAFAGRVAHDLRGPLNTIKLSGSILAESAPGEPRTALILQRGVTQMEQLIEDLLALSRLDSQALGAIAQTASVAAVVEEDLARLVGDVGGKLRFEIPDAAVRCSDGLLRQVLWNLGENAVKYRRDEVPLDLRIVGHAAEADYMVRVTDNGKGMAPDDARAAFEPFFRAPATKAVPGTGLGLAIVRRIIEANGGQVTLTSLEGRGTTVEVHFRLAT